MIDGEVAIARFWLKLKAAKTVLPGDRVELITWQPL
jgi:hypothetical protein